VSALILRLKARPPQRVDMTPVTPGNIGARGIADIVRMQLSMGNRRVFLGEIFDVTPGDSANIIIQSSSFRLDCVGAGLGSGSITVEGDAGACTGLGMRGGRLHVAGNVGPWAAAKMSGGTLSVAGHAGDFLGGALPGDMRGMNGGLVVVRGDAGARAGARMRRGVIAIAGAAGDHAGSRMIAGSLLVLGAPAGAWPGFAMKRGSILLRELPRRMLPTFSDAGTHELGFLRLLSRAIGTEATPALDLAALGTRVRRYVGDAAAAGKGEILVWSS
jgi:formylmethanofuran dehydrogenase subunit C